MKIVSIIIIKNTYALTTNKYISFEMSFSNSSWLLIHICLWVKAHQGGFFWMSQWHFFVGESSIVALYSNIFEKLGKVR